MAQHELSPLSAVHGGLDGLRNEFHSQQEYWAKRGEHAMAALFDAFYYQSTVNPDLAETLNSIIATRRLFKDDLSHSEMAGMLRVALFEDQIEGDKNPDSFVTREDWAEPINEMVRLLNEDTPDEQDRAKRLEDNIIRNAVCTSPFSRGNPDEILMQALTKRFPEGYTLLEVASGMVSSLNHILHKDEHAMSVKSVYELETLRNGHKRWQESPALKQAVANLLGRDHLVEFALATDIVDPYRNTAAQARGRAALRSSERQDVDFMMTYYGVDAGYHPSLDFKIADFTDRRRVEALRSEYRGVDFNLVAISTVLHQLSKRERAAMLDNAQSMLGPNGLIFIKDFAHYTPSRGLDYYKHWHERGRYRGFVYDPARPELDWQELYRFGDSRCLEIAVNSGRVAINGALHQFDKLVLHQGEIDPAVTSVIDLAARQQVPNTVS